MAGERRLFMFARVSTGLHRISTFQQNRYFVLGRAARGVGRRNSNFYYSRLNEPRYFDIQCPAGAFHAAG